MKEFEYVITDTAGIHARPAGKLVNVAKNFSSQAIIEANGRSAKLGGVMGVMSLGARQGTKVRVTVDGDDEEKACGEIKDFFEKNL